MEKERIRDLFTCRNCHWGNQCPASHGQICEYYDSISELEAEMEGLVLEEIERHSFDLQYEELLAELQ